MKHLHDYRVRAYHADGQGHYHFWVQASDEDEALQHADTWINHPIPTAIEVVRVEVERVVR